MWFVYMVRCVDGTLYTGITIDVDRRVEEHNASPLGAKYTRARRPVTLVYVAPYEDRSAATRAERDLKKKSREEKEQLIILE